MTTNRPVVIRGFLRVEDFASALGVKPDRVHAWIREGKLPAIRLGRLTLVPEDALRRMLMRQEGEHRAP